MDTQLVRESDDFSSRKSPDATPHAHVLRNAAAACGLPLQIIHMSDSVPDTDFQVQVFDPSSSRLINPGSVLLAIGLDPTDRLATKHIQRAARAGAAAIVVRADHIPSDVAETVEAAGISLIRLEPGTRWDTVHTDLSRAIETTFAHATSRRSDRDLSLLLDTVSSSINAHVLVLGPTLDVLAHATRPELDADDDVVAAVLERRVSHRIGTLVRDLQRGDADDANFLVAAPWSPGSTVTGLQGDGAIIGFLWVKKPGGDALSGEEITALGSAKKLISRGLISIQGRQNILEDLLGTRVRQLLEAPGSVSGDLTEGLARSEETDAVVLALRHTPSDRAEFSSYVQRVTSMVIATGTAFRIDVQCTTIDGTLYTVVAKPTELSVERIVSFGTRLRWDIEQRLGGRVRVGVGTTVPSIRSVYYSRQAADRVLDIIINRPGPGVATLDDIASLALLRDASDLVDGHRHLRRGIGSSDVFPPESVHTLRVFLDCSGDVVRAAKLLHIHPNTLRYRIRKMAESGVDLQDADQRAVVALELRSGPPQERSS